MTSAETENPVPGGNRETGQAPCGVVKNNSTLARKRLRGQSGTDIRLISAPLSVRLAARRHGVGRVVYYPGKGVVLVAPPTVAVGNLNPSKRGKIKGWSLASRRRMRNALISYGAPDGYTAFGVTLTVPGPVLSSTDTRRLWGWYGHELQRMGCAAIWRAEVQARGAVHWHLVLYAPAELVVSAGPYRGHRLPSSDVVRVVWHAALDTLGPVEHETPCKGGVVRQVSLRSRLVGADVRAVDVQDTEAQTGKLLRYLQDHASKAKQEQIGESIGRHWGIVGRGRLVRVLPDGIDDLPDAAYWRFLRTFQRLCTPVVRCDSAPFGRRVGRRMLRGHRGRSVWFSRPETVKRLVRWAVESGLPRESCGPRRGGCRVGQGGPAGALLAEVSG